MLWLAKEGAGGLTLFWPVTALLVLLIGCGLIWDVRTKHLRFGLRLLYLLLPAAGIPLILFAGDAFERQGHYYYLLDAGLGLGLLAGIIAVVRLRPAWLTSISVSLIWLWYAFWCSFIASMSISGDWL
jgi:hypothetical protein